MITVALGLALWMSGYHDGPVWMIYLMSVAVDGLALYAFIEKRK